MGIERKKKKTKMESDRVLNLSFWRRKLREKWDVKEKGGRNKREHRADEKSTSENTPFPPCRTNCEQHNSHLSMAQTPRAI